MFQCVYSTLSFLGKGEGQGEKCPQTLGRGGNNDNHWLHTAPWFIRSGARCFEELLCASLCAVNSDQLSHPPPIVRERESTEVEVVPWSLARNLFLCGLLLLNDNQSGPKKICPSTLHLDQSHVQSCSFCFLFIFLVDGLTYIFAWETWSLLTSAVISTRL